MSGQHSKIESKVGGLSVYPRRDSADVSLTKRRTDEKERVLRPLKADTKCTHCHEFSAHYVSKDWENATVATKCSKYGKSRKTVLVEGKAMAAAATSADGKTPLMMEDVQEAVDCRECDG